MEDEDEARCRGRVKKESLRRRCKGILKNVALTCQCQMVTIFICPKRDSSQDVHLYTINRFSSTWRTNFSGIHRKLISRET